MKGVLIGVVLAPVLLFVTVVALLFASAPVTLFSPASFMTGNTLTSSVSAPTTPVDTSSIPAAYRTWVVKAGQICAQVSSPLVAAQIDQESSWNPSLTDPTSGAEGIAQFMPETWPSWGQNDDGTHNVSPYNPADAIMALARYDCAIAAQVATVPGDVTSNLLAGYNAGPGAVLQYRGIPPYPETQNYVTQILQKMARYEPAGGGTVGPVKWDGVPTLVLPGGGTNGLPAGFTLPVGTPSRVVIALDFAASKLGLPYQWGGVGDPSYDCSGLMMKAWEAAGISIARGSNNQSTNGVPETLATIKPGDMIFIPGSDGTMALPGHVGIYLGQNLVLQAPYTGAFIDVTPLASKNSSFGPIAAIRRVDTVEPWPADIAPAGSGIVVPSINPATH